MTGTQFLQVPKVLPHRKGRSRSKSRSQEVVSVEEVHIVTSNNNNNSNTNHNHNHTYHRPRLGSPPISAPELAAKPSLNGHIATAKRSSIPAVNMHEVKVEQPTTAPAVSPSINLADLNGEMYTLDDCATPPPPTPEPPLRDKIIGAWKLESYIAYPTPDSTIRRPTYPMTKNVTGFIMYTPDGYVSAQMLIPGQQSFKRGEGEEPQWAEAGKRFFAYSGPYYINHEGPGREEILRHTFQVCNLPGWIGDIQVRTHHFEEDGQVLVLGSEEPTEIKGDKRIPVLKWRRARNNSHGEPPPPTPQIKISGPGEP